MSMNNIHTFNFFSLPVSRVVKVSIDPLSAVLEVIFLAVLVLNIHVVVI